MKKNFFCLGQLLTLCRKIKWKFNWSTPPPNNENHSSVHQLVNAPLLKHMTIKIGYGMGEVGL